MRGHLTKKKKPNSEEFYRNWYIVVDDPNATGKRRQKWIATKTHNKKEAEKILFKILHDLHEGKLSTAKEMTFGELIDQFMKHHVKVNLKPNSIQQYEWSFSKIPTQIKKISAKKVTPIHISSFLYDLNVSSTSRRVVFNSIKTCLKHGILWGILFNNPCDQMTPPKKSTLEKKILGKEELETLLDQAQGTSNYIPLLLISTCGLRRGELCGLQWRDIDLKNHIMRINRSLDVNEGKVIITQTKTKSGARPIRFPSFLSDELKRHKNKWEQILRRKLTPDDFVLIGLDEKNRNPDSVYRGLKRLIQEKNLPETTLHGLRHSHATLMLLEDVPVKVISERLGHSTTKVTQDIYMHVLPDMQDKAAAAVERIFTKKTSNETSNAPRQKR